MSATPTDHRSSRPRRLPALLLSLSLALPAATIPRSPSAVPDATAGEIGLRLDHCNPTVQFFREPAARLEGYVPAPFTAKTDPLGNAIGYIDTQDCTGVSIDGGPAVRTVFSVLGVSIERPDVETQVFGEHHDLYVVAILSDNRELVGRLRDVGMPAQHVDGMSRTPTASPGMHSVEVSVPWKGSAFTTRGMFPVEYWVHDHNLSYWHAGPYGRVGEFELLQYGAVSQGCGNVPLCASVSAEPGSVVAEFLGAPELNLEGWDHREAVQKSRGTIAIRGS